MSDFYFDEKKALKAKQFIQGYLTHTKGELAKQPFLLEDWQYDEIIAPIFGWHRNDGSRKYRTAFIFLPRKNGKSNLAAAILLTLMFLDDEHGAEYYSAANDRDQAKLVFECCRMMIENNPKLNQYVEVFKNSIVYNAKGSYYKAISRESSTKHGFNTSAFVFDEIHAMRSSDENLWQILETSTGSRKSPLGVAITTSGFDRNSYCYKLYDYAKKVKSGDVIDHSFLPVIYEADPDDDIMSEETWKKANPGYGTIIKKDYLEREAIKAQTMPSYNAIFKRLHLNIWTQSHTQWLSHEQWAGCDKIISDDILKQYPCYGGLDLASTRDLSSFALVWKIGDDLITKVWIFLPEDKFYNRQYSNDGVDYQEWAEHIDVTEGNVTDYNFIQKKILELADDWNIKSIAFDRWNASQLVINLTEEGLNMSPFGMGFKSLSAPSKEMESKVLTGNFVHFNNPVLRWQIGNVQMQIDAAGNCKPSKAKSTNKIDSVMSIIMAIGEQMYSEKESPSVYTDRGFLSI